MKKVLLIGNGGREHALGEALTKSGRAELYVFGNKKNPGLLELAKEYALGSLLDFQSILNFTKKIQPDFAVIGPDDPIGEGLADALLSIDIHSVAPLQKAARLESSKSFTRQLFSKYNIPGNPKFKVFLELSGVREFIDELEGNYVVKADGLMAGKGVKVSGEHLQTVEEGIAFAEQCLKKFGRVVVEEKFIGEEFSLMSFVDGKNVVDMPPVQDHKRAFDGDKGPNTGGMGSYSDANHLLPFLKKEDVQKAHEINVKTAEALLKETEIPFKGIMYGGFMAVKDGVRLIEYNARFGDPEALNVLPILQTDFVEICEAILHNSLHRLKIEFLPLATVCKYVVPEGYPEKSRSGEKIVIAEDVSLRGASATKQSLKIYYAAVDQKEDGLYLGSSRALAFVGIGKTLEEAEKTAADALSSVKGPIFYRKDIGTQELIKKRIRHMLSLRE